MVRIALDPSFNRIFLKIKDQKIKTKIIKLLEKIRENPKVGKPMKHSRKGTREIYISPFRLSYIFLEKENKVVIFDFYHKDRQ